MQILKSPSRIFFRLWRFFLVRGVWRTLSHSCWLTFFNITNNPTISYLLYFDVEIVKSHPSTHLKSLKESVFLMRNTTFLQPKRKITLWWVHRFLWKRFIRWWVSAFSKSSQYHKYNSMRSKTLHKSQTNIFHLFKSLKS